MRRIGAIGSIVGALVLCGALFGCNARDAGSLERDTRNLAHDTGQALDSATLVGKVTTALSLRKDVDMSGLHIEGQDGVITLSGHVHSAQERRRVVGIAKMTRGVDRVVNHLRVQP